MRPARGNQPFAETASRPTDSHDVGICPDRVGDLAIAGDDDSLQLCRVDQFLASQGIHLLYQFGQRLTHKKVHPVLHKCLNRSRRARKRSTQRFRDTATREIRVLLGPRQGKLTFDDALIEQDPRIVIPGREDVLERPERVKAGEEWNRQTLTTGIQPQRRWPGQNADGMVAPDRREVANAFWVMPHPISVDEVSTAGDDYIQHAPIDMVGDARDQLLRWFAQAFGPVAAHQFMIAADTTRGDNHRLGFESELAHAHPRTRHAALDGARFPKFAADAINYAIGHGEFVPTRPDA